MTRNLTMLVTLGLKADVGLGLVVDSVLKVGLSLKMCICLKVGWCSILKLDSVVGLGLKSATIKLSNNLYRLL